MNEQVARMLTVDQVAERLRVRPATVREYLRKGELSGRKLGRSWRVVEADLERFILSRSVASEVERVSALGICADIPGFSTEEFLKRKRKEAAVEEAKLRS